MPSSMRGVPFLPVKQIDFQSAKRRKKTLEGESSPAATSSHPTEKTDMTPTAQEISDFNQAIFMCGTKPAMLSLIPEYSDSYIPKEKRGLLTVPLTELFDKDNLELSIEELQELGKGVVLDLTQDMVQNMPKETVAQTGSKLWFRQQAGRITASKLKSVCQANPMKPSPSLVKSICYPDSHVFSTEATRWGLKHEEAARQQYMDAMKHHRNLEVLNTGLHVNVQWPFLGATPDALIECSCCGVGVCEIKCPFSVRDLIVKEAVKTPNFCLVPDGNTSHHLSRQHQYYYQIQAQMGLTGRDFCDFVVWTKSDIYIERVHPDPVFWAGVVEKAEFFFQKALLPELLGRAFTRSAVDSSVPAQPLSPTTCSCPSKTRSRVVFCAAANCTIKRYHLKCANLGRLPKGKWFCNKCENKEN
ncbi:uncharacterized protein LOC144002880 isoform X2 [Festucalex cinctus]